MLDERAPDCAGRADDSDAHSGHLACDSSQEPPANQVMERQLEPPQRSPEKRSETFHPDRGLLAVAALLEAAIGS